MLEGIYIRRRAIVTTRKGDTITIKVGGWPEASRKWNPDLGDEANHAYAADREALTMGSMKIGLALESGWIDDNTMCHVFRNLEE